MAITKHKKHAHLATPLGGKVHRNEIALLGAPCGLIQKLAAQLAGRLSDYKVGYLDAAHNNEEPAGVYHKAYTDQIDFHALKFTSADMTYDFRELFNDCDLVIVNGNHFKAEQQIVFINEKKKESLERKLDRLTHVIGFVLDEGQPQMHDYLKKDFSERPTLPLNDVAGIEAWVRERIQIPKVKGLVLAGGKSVRMGEDKGEIHYHGMPQREYAATLLSGFCEDVYISANEPIDTNFQTLPDSFLGLGPYSGILSAFRHDPNAAWLVIATDIPLLDEASLGLLIEKRNVSRYATCFHNPETSFPEPLITLWEPRAYPRLLQFLAKGYACPRKVLINSEIEELEVGNTDVLLNANTPSERNAIVKKMAKS